MIHTSTDGHTILWFISIITYKKDLETACTLLSQATKINKKDEIIRKFYDDACQLYREEMRNKYKIKNKNEIMESEEDEDEDMIFGSNEEENFNVWADSL